MMAAPEPKTSDYRTSSKAHIEADRGAYHRRRAHAIDFDKERKVHGPSFRERISVVAMPLTLATTQDVFHLVLRFAANNDRGACSRRFNAERRGKIVELIQIPSGASRSGRRTYRR